MDLDLVPTSSKRRALHPPPGQPKDSRTRELGIFVKPIEAYSPTSKPSTLQQKKALNRALPHPLKPKVLNMDSGTLPLPSLVPILYLMGMSILIFGSFRT